MTRLFAMLALVGAAACSSRPMPVMLQGEPMGTAALTGDWTGSYWADSSAHRGSLKFFVGAGEDSTFGDMMMFSPLGERIQPADDGPSHRIHTRMAQSLRVDLKNAGGGRVTGTLEPYLAPDCLCVVTTTFNGIVVGDTIRGSFTTTGGTTENREGSWQLVRRVATKH